MHWLFGVGALRGVVVCVAVAVENKWNCSGQSQWYSEVHSGTVGRSSQWYQTHETDGDSEARSG